MRSGRNRIYISFFVATAAVFLISTPSFAQRPVLEGAASSGSGSSFGKGDGQTVVMMSPVFINADVIYYNSEMPKLEYVIGFQAELQGRVSAGIVPQFRLTTGPNKYMGYGIVGLPLIVAPFVLFGTKVGGGFLFRFHHRVGAFAELSLDLFFIGNDLPDKGILVQLDANIGLRVTF